MDKPYGKETIVVKATIVEGELMWISHVARRQSWLKATIVEGDADMDKPRGKETIVD